MRVRTPIAITVTLAMVSALAAAAPAIARTFEVRYTPFAPDGALRASLHATAAFGGSCTTGSFVVGGPAVFRCVAASRVYDPCYADAVATTPQRAVVACVRSPWSAGVVHLRVHGPLDGRFGAQPDSPPWALRLASGRRCVRVSGAASRVDGQRMNYDCGQRYLFGVPDSSRSTWRIRQALTPGGIGMRKVAIASAWR